MKVRGPLLSGSAHKSLGKTLTYSRRKGSSLVAPYTPNVPTADAQQLSKQSRLADAVSFWKVFSEAAAFRAAWDKFATVFRHRGSGYHLLVQQAILALTDTPLTSLAIDFTPAINWGLTINTRRISGQDAQPDFSNYYVWVGTTPHNMTPHGPFLNPAGVITATNLATTDGFYYVYVANASLIRSGLYRILLEQTPEVDMQYVDRGDPAGYDFTKADLTTDGTWRDLDLSSIVPANAVLVHLCGEVNTAAAYWAISIRKNGNANGHNRVVGRVQQGAVLQYWSGFVACDANRVVEYWCSNGVWTACNIIVRGWFI